MDDIPEFARRLGELWSTKTIRQLHDEAILEENGTAFDAWRTDAGQRLVIVMCITDPKEIQRVEKIMEFSAEPSRVDWESFSHIEFAVHAISAGGCSYEDIREPDGSMSAVALCAVTPEAVRILETTFEFPS